LPPLFADPPEKEHGRLETRSGYLACVEPLTVDFPGAQSGLRFHNEVQEKAKSWKEDIYGISSAAAESLSLERWKQLHREHWGGVEIRCNWRADACLLEDKTRSRNYNILCNTMLLRHTLMAVFVDHMDTYVTLPAFTQAMVEDKNFALRIIRQT
jgi:hypothetical protein